MKISTKGRYGLTIMIELAKEYGEGPIPLRQIAAQNNLSEAYLEQLVSPLTKCWICKKCAWCIRWLHVSNKPTEITAATLYVY